MTASDLQAVLPLIVLAAGATILMLQISLRRDLPLTITLTLLTFALAALSCIPAHDMTTRQVTPLLQADTLAILFSALFCIAGIITTLLSMDYMKHRGDEPEEYFLLLILSTLGACILTYSVHVASLLLGMELMSVALYALVAYPDRSILPLEAASKYLVLSAAASATTLFGFGLLYAYTGTLEFSELGNRLATLPAATNTSILVVAIVMCLGGLGFKLSLVPFHMWTPDVYQGAPSPVTGFLASVSKAAIFLVLLRWFIEGNLFQYAVLLEATALLAILSMLVGNFLALQQSNIKRILAYSSVAHMGYLLIILNVNDNRALASEAALYYLIAYTVTSLAAFGLLSLLSAHQATDENAELNTINGLFWQHPLLAGLLFIALLSLAGIPLTAGFIAKFYIFSAAVSGYHWLLLGSLIIGSGIGIYYYLRVIFTMLNHEDSPAAINETTAIQNGVSVKFISFILIGAILILGIAPQPLIEYLQSIL